MSDYPTREEAYALLTEYNQSESLIKHALSVEAVMRHFAPRFGGDPEVWGVVGLVHDLDYEKWPEEHCKKTEEILKERGWPEELVRAVVSHGWGYRHRGGTEKRYGKGPLCHRRAYGTGNRYSPCAAFKEYSGYEREIGKEKVESEGLCCGG